MHISSEGSGFSWPILARDHLVDRDAGVDVLPFGALRVRRAQVDGRRARVVARAFLGAQRPGHRVIRIADHREAILERRERREDARQLPVLAFAGRLPVRRARAVRHVQEAVAAHALRHGRHRGHHRVEQRQRDGRAYAAQERSARDVSLRNEHRCSLLGGWLSGQPRSESLRAPFPSPASGKAALSTIPTMTLEKR